SELVDEGVIGLIEAAGRYDGRNESRFATYAGFYIERDLRRALARASQVIRIPPYVTTLRGKIKRYINTFTTEHGREPTFDEIQVALGVPASELGTALHTRYSVVSLDSLDDYDSTAGGDGVSLLESLQDHTPPVDETALDHMEQSDLYDRLRRLLTPRELLVIAYRYRLGTLPRYGVDDDDDLSGVEVAARLGVSRQTVFNLEASALAKLRQAYGVSFERALAGRAEQATVR
ncbi:MAG: sigma-70 family RNA polymerase sigma factor, partial [Ktedonobacterales bacterium]